MAIEHRMDGALGRDGNSGESAQEALANLAGTPARVLALHVQDEVFHLEGKLIRIAVGPSASVRQPLHPTLLVATEDFVACLARDPKLPAEIRHFLAGWPASHELQPFIHHRTLLPRHHSLPKNRRKCHPCVRYDVLPMSQAAHSWIDGTPHATPLLRGYAASSCLGL